MSKRKTLIVATLALVAGLGVYFGLVVAGERNRPNLKPLADPPGPVRGTADDQPAAGQHPLDPALQIARKCLEHIETDIQDYSATLIKRERVGDKLADSEQLFVRIRNRPFSVYIYFKAPESVKGQEVVFVEEQNDGNMVVRPVGLKQLLGIVRLKPDGPFAMAGQRYPITEIGILNLTRRLIASAEEGKKYDDCQVKFRKGAKINGRACTCIEVVHPTPEQHAPFYKATVFIDDELQIPVRYAAYNWPATPGGEPELIEEYTYIDVKLNNGFTDADFELK